MMMVESRFQLQQADWSNFLPLASRRMYKESPPKRKSSHMKLHYLHLLKMMQRPPKRDERSEWSFSVMNWSKTQAFEKPSIFLVILCPSVHS